jgi:hypothetical protein
MVLDSTVQVLWDAFIFNAEWPYLDALDLQRFARFTRASYDLDPSAQLDFVALVAVAAPDADSETIDGFAEHIEDLYLFARLVLSAGASGRLD